MKPVIKRLVVLAFCAAFSLVFCLSANAADANEYGLGLAVSCEESDGNATVNISLKNSNNFDVDGIGISAIAADDVHTAEIGTLKAGESFDTAVDFIPLVEQVAVEIPQPEVAPKENHTLKIIIAAIAAIAITGIVLLLIKKNKKAAALMLAVTILMPFAGMFSVHAIGDDEARSFTLETNITVDGKDYPLSVKVDYTASTAKNSYFEFETAPEEAEKDGQTVTRLTTDFSGTATANESVKTVTYEIRSEIDNYESPVTGEADLAGCEWSADRLALKPGKNEITFTAELSSGEKQIRTYELTYDIGKTYQYKPEEIITDGEIKYINNVISIYFNNETTDERISEILSERKVFKIGESNGIRLIQVRTLCKDLNELQKKCEEFYYYDEIIHVDIERVFDFENNSVIPDDPWTDNGTYIETWDEKLPDGNNWNLEAIQALSAWEYDKYFNKSTIGIIDGGFLPTHEDFTNLIKFATPEQEEGNNVFLSNIKDNLNSVIHGTHVSGIIGATANNGIGISGILWDAEIYAASYLTGGTNTINNVTAHLDKQVSAGAKAINLSIGLDNKVSSSNPNPYTNPYSESALKATAEPCAVAMHNLLQSGLEFVVVQSAGNGARDTRIGSMFINGDYVQSPYSSIDATQNGLFCSIRNDTSYGSGADYIPVSQVKEIFDRIIVVGAAINHSNETNGVQLGIWYRSNGGKRVDIYAPGVDIFSTIYNAVPAGSDHAVDYFSMTGTSQAAPHITAIAGLCFSINPNFTGKKVKEIICDKANASYIAHDSSLIYTASNGQKYDLHPFTEEDVGISYVVNMKLCAEAALRTVCGLANYSALNRTIAIVQSLDPNAYTNYELVQEVLNSIDYKIYEFEQKKVDDKNNELKGALYKLQEKDPADYSAVTEAVNRANALNPEHYVDFSGVTAAVNAVVYGKYADEQEAVDKMAQDINDAVNSLELLCKIESSDSEVIADNYKHIIVIVQEKIADLLKYLSTGGYTATLEPNKYGKYSTGAIVKLTKTNTRSVDEGIEYTVVTVGDANGDGEANAEDAMLVNLCVSGAIEMPDEKLFPAYDANCDGSITSDDVELLERVGLSDDVIINFYEAEDAA